MLQLVQGLLPLFASLPAPNCRSPSSSSSSGSSSSSSGSRSGSSSSRGSSYDVAIVGGGPNALRLLACLSEGTNASAVAFEREEVGHTIRQWYEGSVSHSPRHTFQIGSLTPRECSQCLDNIWDAPKPSGSSLVTPPARKCKLDHGKMQHCGRDEYIAYMQRVMRNYTLPVCEHEQVLGVSRVRNGTFEVTTRETDRPDPSNYSYTASMVVFAFGAISYPKGLPQSVVRTSGAHVSDTLGSPKLYSGKHVLVVGTGPSGMETAVRLCSESYNAAHVTLASRSKALMPAWNVYINESLWRIRKFVAEGRMTLQLLSGIESINATHARLRVAPHGQPSYQVDTRADHVIAAVGFTSDLTLIRSAQFPNGNIARDTCETSIPGIFNVGISSVAPWTSKGSRRTLSTFIEDSQPQVTKVCKAIISRLDARRSATAQQLPPPLEPTRASVQTRPETNLTLTTALPRSLAATPMAPGLINCSKTLWNTSMARMPYRTSFAVMDYVAARAHGKRFVELGSTMGDVIECVSHHTTQATSIEASEELCKVLEARAHASDGRWRSICAKFPTPQTPAAEVFFSWIYTFLTVPFIQGLRALQDEGRVPRDAQLLLAFSDTRYKRYGVPVEHNCFRALSIMAESHDDLPFDEGQERRAKGIVHIATMLPAKIDMAALSANPHIRTCCSATRFGRCNTTLLPSYAPWYGV